MNNKHYLGKRVSSFDLYDEIGPITGVVLIVHGSGEDFEFIAEGSDDSGYVLEIPYPYSHQGQMVADTIFQKVKGKTYKGFRVTGARFDPMAELGDGVTANGVYSMMAYRRANFGPNHTSEVAAPGENAVQHEYSSGGGAPSEVRKLKAEAYSLIAKSVDEILFEVSKVETSVNEELKKYAKLDITTDAISAAVSESKQYTDGQFTEKLSDYATVKMLTDEISASVSSSKEYTDGQFTEKLSDYATVKMLTDEISASVSSSKEYTDGQFTEKLSDYATVKMLTDEISASVSSSKEYTDGQLTTMLSSYSTITQTADAIVSAVESYVGDFGTDESGNVISAKSVIEQTAAAIREEVSGYVDGDYVSSSITTALEGITLAVSSSDGSTTLSIKSGETTISTETLNLTVDAANITGTLTVGVLPDDVAMSEDIPTHTSDLVNDSDYQTKTQVTTITNNAISTAYISADQITTGTLSADQIALDGLLGVKLADSYYGYIGASTASSEMGHGVAVCDSTASVGLLAMTTGVKMTFKGNDNQIWVSQNNAGIVSKGSYYQFNDAAFYSVDGCLLGTATAKWGQIYSTNSAISTSDREEKNSIEYEIDDRYDKLWDLLKPCTGKYNAGTSDRTHMFLISQDVEDAVEAAGLTSKDFAAFIKSPKEDNEGNPIDGYIYGLRYEEFIPLCIRQIQKLQARVRELEDKTNGI